MGIKIDIAPKDLKALKDLLKQYLPKTLVWAFGSRVKFTAKPTSDLDLVAFINKEQELKFSLLKDAFEESSIPFRIDLHNWHELPETFHKNIKNSFVILQDEVKEELPGEWKTYKLSELVEIKYGKSHKHLADGKIPLYGSGGIMRYVDTPLYEQESILIPRKGTLSNLFYLNIPFWSVDTMFYTKIKSGNNGKYLFYLLKSMDLASMNVGSAVPSLTTEVLNKVEINVPDEATQIEIAQILTSLDDKIELNLQMNETLEAMAQALFKEWFVNFNFPNFDGELENGLPKGWKHEPMDERIDFLNGLALQKFPPLDEDDFLPVIKIREFKQGFTNASDKASTELPEKYVIYDGDILFSWSGSLEVVLWCEGKGALNQHLFKVSSNVYPKWFYFFWVREYLPLYKSIAEGKATTMGHIQRRHLTDTIINVPNKELMNLADSILSPILVKIQENKIQIQSLTQTRDTLLPKLMNGKIEIKN